MAKQTFIYKLATKCIANYNRFTGKLYTSVFSGDTPFVPLTCLAVPFVVGPSPPAFSSWAGSFLPLSWRAFLAASSSSGSSSGFLYEKKKTEENRLKMCKCSQHCMTLPKHKGLYSVFLYLHTFFLIMCEISFAGSDDAFVGDAVDVSPPKPVDVPYKYIQNLHNRAMSFTMAMHLQ